MNPITQARQDVKAALAALENVSVHDHLPERLHTDAAAVVTPGDPYVVPGQTFGEFKISLNVTVMSRLSDSPVVTQALDELIADALEALKPFGHAQAAQPHIEDTYKPTLYMASRIAINTTYEGGN